MLGEQCHAEHRSRRSHTLAAFFHQSKKPAPALSSCDHRAGVLELAQQVQLAGKVRAKANKLCAFQGARGDSGGLEGPRGVVPRVCRVRVITFICFELSAEGQPGCSLHSGPDRPLAGPLPATSYRARRGQRGHSRARAHTCKRRRARARAHACRDGAALGSRARGNFCAFLWTAQIRQGAGPRRGTLHFSHGRELVESLTRACRAGGPEMAARRRSQHRSAQQASELQRLG